MDEPESPTAEELRAAHQVFQRRESRDVFYRAATELIRLAREGATNISVSDALAGLLLTWNRQFYRFRPDLLETLPDDLDSLLAEHRDELERFRERSIESFEDSDERAITELFDSFDRVLRPVGAAKTLHLLAPNFFPLWDDKIARAYGLGQPKRGRNAERYLRLMEIVREQCRRVGGERALGRNPVKAIDEFNYCRYTRGWI